MKALANYFSWEEVTHSDIAERLGIDNNIVHTTLIPNIKYTATRMDGVRAILGTPILIDSWYRCLALNRILKSKDTSDHILGLAVDFISPNFGSPLDICKYLLQYKDTLNWNQLILEHTWVHISFPRSIEIPAKKEVLTLLANGHYVSGLTDKLGKPA